MVDGRGPDRDRRVLLAGVDRRQAAHGLAQEVLSRPLFIRAVRAVPREGSVHDVRLLLGDFFVTEAQALHSAWPIVLDDDVGITDQTPHDLLTPLGAQVHAKAALVAPAEEEEDANPTFRYASAPDQWRSQAPPLGVRSLRRRPRGSARIWTAEGLAEVREAKDLYPVQHSLTGPCCDVNGSQQAYIPTV